MRETILKDKYKNLTLRNVQLQAPSARRSTANPSKWLKSNLSAGSSYACRRKAGALRISQYMEGLT